MVLQHVRQQRVGAELTVSGVQVDDQHVVGPGEPITDDLGEDPVRLLRSIAADRMSTPGEAGEVAGPPEAFAALVVGEWKSAGSHGARLPRDQCGGDPRPSTIRPG
ncbi:MAG TPA: hypothetical protein VMW33_01150 [Ilumatobacteraceae bacterium]|jgi:hypothetical protein|nr:hypothetical protein [Ilumatobacteraceae bacterium]